MQSLSYFTLIVQGLPGERGPTGNPGAKGEKVQYVIQMACDVHINDY